MNTQLRFDINDVFLKAFSVFNSDRAGNIWMYKANKLLGGDSPYKACNTQDGMEKVYRLLMSLEEGL